MRYQGRLTDWNDDKGFGFVTPNGGGERAFVHIKAFGRVGRRPCDGDLINYEVSKDRMGRLQAGSIRLSGTPANTARENSAPAPTGQFAVGCGALFFIALGLLVAYGRLPVTVPFVYAMASLLTFMVYAFDKSAAMNKRRRTPENTLHLLALAGGWPGALLAQTTFRHKSRKIEFQTVFWATVLFNTAALGFLLTPDGASFLDTGLH